MSAVSGSMLDGEEGERADDDYAKGKTKTKIAATPCMPHVGLRFLHTACTSSTLSSCDFPSWH